MSFPFTIEDIEAAYAETGLKPICLGWFGVVNTGNGETRCACPMSVLAARKVGSDVLLATNEIKMPSFVSETLGIDEELMFSFVSGFDGDPPYDYGSYYVRNPEFKEAYDLGAALRRKIHPIDFDFLSE